MFFFVNFFKAICFTKKVGKLDGFSGNFPCSQFDSCPGCLHSLKCDEKRNGFPFELTEAIGEGGFATVYRGKFHKGEAAFKFIPIANEGYKYDYDSTGIYEYGKQKKINKITEWTIFDDFVYR